MTAAAASSSEPRASLDFLTLAAIAVVAYTLASVLHEALGHGLTSTLLGGRVVNISSSVCICGGENLPAWAQRAISAGGTLVNLAAFFVFWGLLRALPGSPVTGRYFLWLSMTVNGLMGAGYLAVPTLIGFGDWTDFIQGLSPGWAWQAGLVGVGVILYLWFAYVAVRELDFFLGRERSGRRARAWTLGLVPYLTGGVAFCLAGLFNPIGPVVVAISSAASSFGGASGLVWIPSWAMNRQPAGSTPDPAPTIMRDWRWVAVGGLTLLVLVFVLGPGISFSR